MKIIELDVEIDSLTLDQLRNAWAARDQLLLVDVTTTPALDKEGKRTESGRTAGGKYIVHLGLAHL